MSAGRRRGFRLAVMAAGLMTVGAGLPALGTPGGALPTGTSSDTASLAEAARRAHEPWLVSTRGGVGVYFDPVLGRTFTVGAGGVAAPPERVSKAGSEAGAGASAGSNASTPGASAPPAGSPSGSAQPDRFDARLAGQRRSVFYRPTEPTTGPGTIRTVLGGMCDGLPGPKVAVDPSLVKVDRAGRVFWVDQNWNGHFKGSAYVRVMEPDGRVRTLGSVLGPVEGRFFRDTASSAGPTRLVPDGKGGVFYTFEGHWTGLSPSMVANDVWDDVPLATVIGHLTVDGKTQFVAGVPGWRRTRLAVGMVGDTEASFGWSGGEAPGGAQRDGLDGRPFAGARFRYITGMAADAAGNLFVLEGDRVSGQGTAMYATPQRRSSADGGPPDWAEDSADVVLRFLNRSGKELVFYPGTDHAVRVPAGQVQTIAGDRDATRKRLPPPVFGQSADPRKVRLSYGMGLDVDGAGNVRILQAGAQDVQVLGINTGPRPVMLNGVRLTAGALGVLAGAERGFAGDGGTGKDARFDVRNTEQWYLGDLARGADGSVFVADTVNNRVRRLDPAGRVSTVVGTGVGRFDGDGRPGRQSSLWFPMGVAAGPAGQVLVADWKNARIRVLREGVVRTLVGTGSAAMCGDGTRAAGGSLTAGAGTGQPQDAVQDSVGNTYVADLALGVVRRIDPAGIVRTVVGVPRACPSGAPAVQGIALCPAPQPAGDGGPPAQAVLQAPGYLLVDRYDNLYISDGAQVRYVNFRSYDLKVQDVPVPAGTIATVLQAQSELRRVDLPQPSRALPKVSYESFVGLGGLALSRDGTLYVADILHNQVLSKNWCGALLTVVGTGAPAPTTGAPAPTTAGGDNGSSNGDSGPAASARLTPLGLALDPVRQVLFISTAAEGRVRAVNLGSRPVALYDQVVQPGFITTVAGGAPCRSYYGDRYGKWPSCVNGDGGAAVQAALRAPLGLAVSPGGRLFIADPLANLVRVVEPNGRIGTLAGITPDYDTVDNTWSFVAWPTGGACGDGGRAYLACLSGTTSVQLTPSGDALVAQSSAGRVRRITDAVRSPLRPQAVDPPVLGARWRFTPGQVLRNGQPAGFFNPTLVVDSAGDAFVTAAQKALDSSAPQGCPLWRYQVNAGGAGRDRQVDLGKPEQAGLGAGPALPVGAAGTTCSMTVHPPAPNSVVPPLGGRDRLSHVSVIGNRDSAFDVSLTVRAAASRDAGGTFVTVPVHALTGVPPNNLQISAADPNNTYGVYWDGKFVVGAGGLVYTDRSQVPFVDRTSREQYPDDEYFFNAPLVNGSQIYVPFHVVGDACNSGDPSCTETGRRSKLFVARSSDGGSTWTRSAPIFSLPCNQNYGGSTSVFSDPQDWCRGFHGRPSVALDTAGNLYATWDAGGHVFLSTSGDGGKSWTPAVRVDRGLNLASFPALVAGVDGRVAVAFYGSTSRSAGSFDPAAEWWVYLAQSSNARSARPTFTQSVASQQRVHSGMLCQRRTACSWATDAPPAMGDFLAIALQPKDGRVIIAYARTAGDVGQGSGSKIVLTRQCDGPDLLGNRRALLCAKDARPVSLPAALPPVPSAPVAMPALPPLPCSALPPPRPDHPAQPAPPQQAAQRPAPAGQPLGQPQPPPAPKPGAPVHPPAQPVTPAGPAPAPNPAPGSQVQTQVQTQAQPGGQAALAGEDERQAARAHGFAASRPTRPGPVGPIGQLWLLTAIGTAAVISHRARRRRLLCPATVCRPLRPTISRSDVRRAP